MEGRPEVAKTRFHARLHDRINEVLEGQIESIIGGEALDFASYKGMAGYIRGLNDALRICEDIERDLDA
jgi:hypothetical protein